MALLVCFHILYFQEAANCSWLSATSPAWGYSIYKHSFIYFLYSQLMMGSLADTVKTLQKQSLLQGARKISAPGPGVRSLRDTTRLRVVPDLRTRGGEVFTNHSFPHRQSPQRRRPLEDGLWGTSPFFNCPVASGAAGRFED